MIKKKEVIQYYLRKLTSNAKRAQCYHSTSESQNQSLDSSLISRQRNSMPFGSAEVKY
jgi:hypothetical protein